MRVVGVDGWREGWVAVVLEDGRFAGAFCAGSLARVLETEIRAAVVAVDIPLGPPARGVRRADRYAKKRLGSRASSVFLTPPRRALEVATHDEAKAMCGQLEAPLPSRQAWALRARILEADLLPGLFEVHPEVSFLELAGRLLPRKKTWAGMVGRRQALRGAGIVIPDELDAGAASPDDILDAAAAAWSADRIARNAAGTLPEDPEPGEPVIWF